MSAQLTQVGVHRVGGPDTDSSVEHLGAIGKGDDRVELQLGDLREIIGYLGDPQQHALDRGKVGAGRAVTAEQCPGGTHRADQLR